MAVAYLGRVPFPLEGAAQVIYDHAGAARGEEGGVGLS